MSHLTINMFVERFHRILKEVYLEKKQNRRVDHLIFKLRKISRDKAFEQLIKAEKGKNTVRQRESTKRHKQGESVKKEGFTSKMRTSGMFSRPLINKLCIMWEE